MEEIIKYYEEEYIAFKTLFLLSKYKKRNDEVIRKYLSFYDDNNKLMRINMNNKIKNINDKEKEHTKLTKRTHQISMYLLEKFTDLDKALPCKRKN